MMAPLTSRLDIQTLLLPTDGSEAAEAARPLAETLAARHAATLHVLHVEVVPPATDLWFEPPPEADREADGVVEAHRRSPTVSDAIVRYADEVGADLVVMGSHGRSGWNRLTLGSTAEAVLRRVTCPVLTVGPNTQAELDGPVLVPLAFESSSDVALETAVAVAEELGTRVVALHVVEPFEIPIPYSMTIEPFDQTDLTARVEETLRRWVSGYADGSVPVDVDVRLGDAALCVLDAADEVSASLVVQASHGRRGPARWILGSVAEEVARKAPCPVLTLRIGTRPLVHPGLDESPSLAVPRADWADLFDALSRRAAGASHEVSVEVLSPGAEGVVFRAASLVGMVYDPRADTLDVIAKGGEHHVVRPFAVRSEAGAWALDGALDPEAPGPWALDIVDADGARRRVVVRPVAEAVAG